MDIVGGQKRRINIDLLRFCMILPPDVKRIILRKVEAIHEAAYISTKFYYKYHLQSKTYTQCSTYDYLREEEACDQLFEIITGKAALLKFLYYRQCQSIKYHV